MQFVAMMENLRTPESEYEVLNFNGQLILYTLFSWKISTNRIYGYFGSSRRGSQKRGILVYLLWILLWKILISIPCRYADYVVDIPAFIDSLLVLMKWIMSEMEWATFWLLARNKLFIKNFKFCSGYLCCISFCLLGLKTWCWQHFLTTISESNSPTWTQT